MGEEMRGRILDIDLDGPAVRRDPQQPRRLVAADEELAAVVEGDPVRQPRQVACEGPGGAGRAVAEDRNPRSEEHTSELQSLMRNSYAVFCLKQTKHYTHHEQ